MYNDEFNNNDMYRFTNRDMPRDDYAPAPRQENVPAVPAQKAGFFRRTWVKITALVLACVVAGGAAGYGGAALAKGGSGSGAAISESDRTVTAVKVKKVDGKTKMQPAEVYASTVNSTVSINCSSQQHQHLRPDHPVRLQRQRLYHQRGRLYRHQLPCDQRRFLREGDAV